MTKSYSKIIIETYLKVCTENLGDIKNYIGARTNDEIVLLKAELIKRYEENRNWEMLFSYLAVSIALYSLFKDIAIYAPVILFLMIILITLNAHHRIKDNGVYKKAIFYLETYSKIKNKV